MASCSIHSVFAGAGDSLELGPVADARREHAGGTRLPCTSIPRFAEHRTIPKPLRRTVRAHTVPHHEDSYLVWYVLPDLLGTGRRLDQRMLMRPCLHYAAAKSSSDVRNPSNTARQAKKSFAFPGTRHLLRPPYPQRRLEPKQAAFSESEPIDSALSNPTN